MNAKKFGLTVAGVCGAALVASATPALAAYNSAGSAQVATASSVASVANTAASTIAGGIGAAVGGGGAGGSRAAAPGFKQSGKAAGNMDQGFGVWLNAGWDHLKNDPTNTQFKGNTYTGAIGADVRIGDSIVVGLAATGEDTKLDTQFNLGHLKTTGWGIGPYAAISFLDNFYIDALVNRSWLHNTGDRGNGANTFNYDSKRWIAASHLGARLYDGPLMINPYIGYLYVTQKDDSYTETGTGAGAGGGQKVSVAQGQLGGKLGYTMGQFTPYVGARWEHNFVQPNLNFGALAGGSPSNNRDAGYYQVGFNADLDDGVSGGFEGNTRQSKDFTSYGVRGNIRVAF
jgi:hypothetical protein